MNKVFKLTVNAGMCGTNDVMIFSAENEEEIPEQEYLEDHAYSFGVEYQGDDVWEYEGVEGEYTPESFISLISSLDELQYALDCGGWYPENNEEEIKELLDNNNTC